MKDTRSMTPEEIDAELATAEREYEEELRHKPIHELTPQEIGYLHDSNEGFHGLTPDFDKIGLYRQLEEKIQGFIDGCDEVIQVEKLRPNPRERHALICLDVKPIATLDRREVAMLTELLQLADRVTVSANGMFTRFSLAVEDIWKEE